MRIPVPHFNIPIHRSGETEPGQYEDWTPASQALSDLWDEEGGNIHRQTWPHRPSDDWVVLEGQRGFYWRRLEDPDTPEIPVTDHGYPTGETVHSCTLVAPAEFQIIRAGGQLGITTTYVSSFYERVGARPPSTPEIVGRIDQCLGDIATRQIPGPLS